MRGIAGGKASATSSSDDRPGCSSIGSTPHQGKLRPRRAGRSPGWPTRAGECGASWVGRVRHPIDLPEGYHTATRGQSSPDRVALRRGPPPGRRVVGRCQVDGMPHEPVPWSRGQTPKRLDTAEVRWERNGSASVSTTSHATPRPGTTPQLRWPATSAGWMRWGSDAPFTPKRSLVPSQYRPPAPDGGRAASGTSRFKERQNGRKQAR